MALSLRFDVLVQPRASRNEIAGHHDGRLKIRHAAPPVDNAANQALVDFVAQRLGITRRSARIVAGATRRRKTVEVEGVSADALAVFIGVSADAIPTPQG